MKQFEQDPIPKLLLIIISPSPEQICTSSLQANKNHQIHEQIQHLQARDSLKKITQSETNLIL